MSDELMTMALDRRRAGRRLRERLFELAGLAALVLAAGMLFVLVAGVVSLGARAFVRHEATLTASLDANVLGVAEKTDLENGVTQDPVALRTADYRAALRDALLSVLDDAPTAPADVRAMQALLSPGGEFILARRVSARPDLVGASVPIRAPLSDDADLYFKGGVSRDEPPDRRTLTDQQMDWLDALRADRLIRPAFNADFFIRGDSSYPELAGVAAGVVGSLIAVGVAIALAAPLGIITAVFLEEFAPKNRFTDFIEINVNNLAAVPSIIFGLLGLTAFILFFGMPRSAPLVGGLVLSLMTLPTIIISTRTSLRALPKSLKEGGLALGASRLGVVWNPMLPAAAPGIITGVILGFAQALGETAPLLLVGMVAFVATPAASALDPSSALPVLIYLWAESPERAFVEKTAGAVIVLLVFLVSLNGAAAFARRRFDPYRK